MTKPLSATQLWDMANKRGLAEGPRPKEKTRKPRSQEESRAQRAVIVWWNNHHADFGLPACLLHSVPNGGFRSVVTASIMKAEGQRRGVFDIKLNVARSRFHGLWVEMKAEKGILSGEQNEFMDAVEKQGYCVSVCRSATQAIEKIIHYLAS